MAKVFKSRYVIIIVYFIIAFIYIWWRWTYVFPKIPVSVIKDSSINTSLRTSNELMADSFQIYLDDEFIGRIHLYPDPFNYKIDSVFLGRHPMVPIDKIDTGWSVRWPQDTALSKKQ
jgi:hypothetical protein